ncbi:uncharacterized protein LOC110734134 [Chenopodium quinoa]|uniref:uncharacterized protein LOC110734134 n=1 Tax=Chenopodium quinoa TaxID=63459 RepID=UPI000B77F9C6|nr:uncharacterized protein LOC110734134 [Chenopodium quinoa]
MLLCTPFSLNTKDNRSVVTCHRFIFMGPTHLLPEKADTLGCLYCCSNNIHHPHFHESFQRGAEHLYPTLCSQLQEIRTYIAEGLKKAEKEEALFIPNFSHPGVKYLPNMSTKDIAMEDVALHFFYEKEGTNFELVKKGPIATSRISIGLIRHLNFEAKDKIDPDVPVQTFFAQVIRNRFFYFANFCKCLGPSDSLPDKADICGCRYCDKTHVHHPPGSGYLTGRECLNGRE